MYRADELQEVGYNRQKAVDYAHKWALKRNPRYYNFTGIGGDCANFASQCLYEGAGVMNYRPLYGWYYVSSNDRTPSWSAVKYLYNFLTGNRDIGPYATEAELIDMQPGDIIQLSTYLEDFHHTLVVVSVDEQPTLDNTLIACHSYDSDNRPLSSYDIKKIRFLHVGGVRKPLA